MKGKRYILTGASGCLGGHLLRALVKEGAEVICISRQFRDGEDAIEEDGRSCHWVRVDMSEPFRWNPDFDRVDGIFHLASQLDSHSNADVSKMIAVNVGASFWIMSLLNRIQADFLVYASTCSIYGKAPTTGKLDERTPPSPISTYAQTKYLAETLFRVAIDDRPTKLLIIRFTSLYGKGAKYGIIYEFRRLAESHQSIELLSEGRCLRNFLHVEDAVDLLLSIARRASQVSGYELFVAGGKESVSTCVLAEMIVEAFESRSPIVLKTARASYDWNVIVDNTKAVSLLSFNPMDLKNGILRYCKEHQ